MQLAPSEAKRCAIAAPIPREAPVIMHLLFLRSDDDVVGEVVYVRFKDCLLGILIRGRMSLIDSILGEILRFVVVGSSAWLTCEVAEICEIDVKCMYAWTAEDICDHTKACLMWSLN